MPTTRITAAALKAALSDGEEIALLDVREAGQFGEGHPFFAAPLPYSRLELDLPGLVPNRGVRVVLCDDDDGVAERARRRAESLGYGRVATLDGGVRAWQAAGYTLYKGVNLPSKAFGELIEHGRHTPRVTPQELAAMRAAGDDLVVVDGRPFSEYGKMSIPGGVCCPNGELALRIGDVVPGPTTRIVVNCAGRTRSIIGAQTLIDLGVPNPVLALENGTQGWFLAGLELERGARRRYPDRSSKWDMDALRARAARFAAACHVRYVTPQEARALVADTARTTYLLDVRTPEELAAGSAPGFVHAPGGQLIQATDQWVGVRGARLILIDDETVRAPVVAGWLRQLGHEALVLTGGLAAARGLGFEASAPAALPAVRTMPVADAAKIQQEGSHAIIDLRSSAGFRAGHIAGAAWGIRPRLPTGGSRKGRPILLVAEDAGVAALAALDLAEGGAGDVRVLEGGFAAWQAAGLPVEQTPAVPSDKDRIDFLFFVHDRHDGNAEAARGYIAWEMGLVAQLDAQERGVFRLRS